MSFSIPDSAAASAPVPLDNLLSPTVSGRRPHHTYYGVLAGVSAAHMVNDVMQSLIVTIYPLFKAQFHLSFIQIGLITLTFQITAYPCCSPWWAQ